MNDITRTSKELVRTPWRAETFAVYDAAGELVVHTGVLGNRLSNAQRETIARVVVEAVNAYSSNEPPPEQIQRYELDSNDRGAWLGGDDKGPFVRYDDHARIVAHLRAALVPKVCCQDFDNCEHQCIPLVRELRRRAAQPPGALRQAAELVEFAAARDGWQMHDYVRDLVILAKRAAGPPPECAGCEEFVRMQHELASLLGVDADTDSIDLHGRIYGALSTRASQPPAPALRPDGMPEPSLDVLKCVAARMRTDAPDSAYLVEWAAEQIEQLTAIARAARNVCAYDWSDNDDDAVATIDRLHAVVGPWLARSTPTKAGE